MGYRSFIVRFADDCIIGRELKTDAVRVLSLLRERFELFALKLHSTKTKRISFGKPARC